MNRETEKPEHLLTIADVADIQRTSTRTVRRRIAAGDLPAVRDGRLIRVRPQDLRRYQLQKMLG